MTGDYKIFTGSSRKLVETSTSVLLIYQILKCMQSFQYLNSYKMKGTLT